MALTRKLLRSMGIEDDKIDQIIEAHGETVSALKDERDQYRDAAEALPGVQKELDDLKAKPEQVKSLIEDMAQNYENPAEVVAWYYADKQRLANVESMALEDSVVDFVLGKAKVVEKTTAFDELMGQQA